MGAPGWSLTEPTLLADITVLPESPLWTSDMKGVEEAALLNETQRGYRTAYRLFRRGWVASLTFRFNDNDYASFQALHDAVDGSTIAFWFVPDSSVMGTKYNVRKERDFKPKAIEPVRDSGSLVQRWEYTLQLSSEVADEELED